MGTVPGTGMGTVPGQVRVPVRNTANLKKGRYGYVGIKHQKIDF